MARTFLKPEKLTSDEKHFDFGNALHRTWHFLSEGQWYRSGCHRDGARRIMAGEKMTDDQVNREIKKYSLFVH